MTFVTQVNAAIGKVNEALKSPARQKERERQKLYNAYQASMQWETKGPETLFNARKNYWVFTDGEIGYNEKMMQEYTAAAAADAGKEQLRHEARMETIDNQVQSLAIGDKTLGGLKRLQKTLRVEAKELSKAEKDALGTVNTNNARVALSVGADETLQMFRSAVTTIYVVALLVYLWRGPFITGREYNTIRGWTVALSLIAFVYFSSAITTWVMRLWAAFWWLLADNTPRDVYTDLDA